MKTIPNTAGFHTFVCDSNADKLPQITGGLWLRRIAPYIYNLIYIKIDSELEI